MKAMILAAGFGTRLKPWTDSHPKALVPVAGVPMLERVIVRLRDDGFDYIVVNVHHFGEQIIDYLDSHDFGITVKVSDERNGILDTGEGIASAAGLLMERDDSPFLVHNVDILSDAPLASLMERNMDSADDVTLLTSGRESKRRLVFDRNGSLKGWHNVSTGDTRPKDFIFRPEFYEKAFAGIYVMNRKALDSLVCFARRNDRFPIMDFFLSMPQGISINQFNMEDLRLIDIGKPDTLRQAEGFAVLPGMK